MGHSRIASILCSIGGIPSINSLHSHNNPKWRNSATACWAEPGNRGLSQPDHTPARRLLSILAQKRAMSGFVAQSAETAPGRSTNGVEGA